jgi:hypothetical protein
MLGGMRGDAQPSGTAQVIHDPQASGAEIALCYAARLRPGGSLNRSTTTVLLGAAGRGVNGGQEVHEIGGEKCTLSLGPRGLTVVGQFPRYTGRARE